jgi:sugar phosphate isomerase/epimerase
MIAPIKAGEDGMRIRFAAHLALRAIDRPLFACSARSTAPLDQIAYVADLGLAGIFDNFLAERPVAEQEAIGRAVAARGLAFGSFAIDRTGGLDPWWSRADPEARAYQAAMVDRAVAPAARVGGQTISVVTGLDPARPAAAQRAAMAESLARIADRAADGGLVLCVEPVAASFIPGLLLGRLAEAAEVVAAVAHPAVRLAYDAGHIAMAGDDPVAGLAARGAGDIGLVQVADIPNRIDLGAGSIDWPAFFIALAATGYVGLIELEHEASMPGIAGEAALVARLSAIDRAVGGK